MPPVLEAVALGAGYHGHAVVSGVHLSLRAGEVCALLGPNGAGKTTTLLTLAGELPVVAGSVLLHGQETRAPLHRRARRGLSFVTEERSVFRALTVRDNLRVCRADEACAMRLFPELERLRDRRAGLLSGGEQQMLTVARALARHPSLLLVDELSLGLAPLVVNRLLDAVRDAARTEGVAVLLVEQHLRKALAIADHAVVMSRGKVVLEGSGTALASRLDQVEAAYFATEDGGDA